MNNLLIDILSEFYLYIIGLVVIGLIAFCAAGFQGYGSGTQVGYVTSIETSGLFQINRVYIKTDLSSSNEDVYCFDDHVREELEMASKAKTNVIINYDERGVEFPWACDTATAYVTDVEAITNTY